MTKLWKDIPGYKCVYQASNRGQIRRAVGGPGAQKGRILKQPCNSKGYRCVTLCGKSLYVHRLILMTFIGHYPSGLRCRHLDGNPNNNHLSNLKWGTGSENQQDCIRHGTRLDNRGSKNWAAKLTESQIPKIRQLILDGVTHQKIADNFGVSRVTITCIAIGKTWKHI